ncbi:MAG: hypothetical protein H0W86_07335 [Armatimonadetes bacterium]|nr:hypothetical protein [Armatimonadota bacterium]
MDSRERLVAAARGGAGDRAPWFAWSPATSARTATDFAKKWKPDAVVVESAIDCGQVLAEAPDVAVLVEVGNPFGEAMQAGVDLNEEFSRGPIDGSSAFGAYSQGVASSLQAALRGGADGVLYRLFGADPGLSSPMQFGGFYLEKERELLQSIADARLNVLYVEGGEEMFLDVLADLPAQAFSWDEGRSHISPHEVRKVRKGALACGLESDHRKLWDDFGGTGLIFCGQVSDLSEYDFSVVSEAAQDLPSPAAHE